MNKALFILDIKFKRSECCRSNVISRFHWMQICDDRWSDMGLFLSVCLSVLRVFAHGLAHWKFVPHETLIKCQILTLRHFIAENLNTSHRTNRWVEVRLLWNDYRTRFIGMKCGIHFDWKSIGGNLMEMNRFANTHRTVYYYWIDCKFYLVMISANNLYTQVHIISRQTHFSSPKMQNDNGWVFWILEICNHKLALCSAFWQS